MEGILQMNYLMLINLCNFLLGFFIGREVAKLGSLKLFIMCCVWYLNGVAQGFLINGG